MTHVWLEGQSADEVHAFVHVETEFVVVHKYPETQPESFTHEEPATPVPALKHPLAPAGSGAQTKPEGHESNGDRGLCGYTGSQTRLHTLTPTIVSVVSVDQVVCWQKRAPPTSGQSLSIVQYDLQVPPKHPVPAAHAPLLLQATPNPTPLVVKHASPVDFVLGKHTCPEVQPHAFREQVPPAPGVGQHWPEKHEFPVEHPQSSQQVDWVSSPLHMPSPQEPQSW